MKKNKSPQKNRKKIAIILFFSTILLFVVFVSRFSYVMVKGQINGEDLSEKITNLYTRSSVLKAKRGTIYDVDGKPIAMDAASYSLVAVLTDKWSTKENPNYVKDKEKTAELLSKNIPLSKEAILEQLNQKDENGRALAQVEFGNSGKDLSYETKVNIEKAKLPGLIFEETPKRLYPNGVFASNLVGIASIPTKTDANDSSYVQNNQLVGTMGIEQAYNKLLTGTDGKYEYQKDSFGYALPNSKVKEVEAKDGSDLYLTLNNRLQVFLENKMSEVAAKYQPKTMTATLMNAKTGAIIATTQSPTFNSTTKENIDQSWRNLLVEDTFEPGSTMKILTLGAAINEGVFNPNETYTSGVKKVEGGEIRDHNKVGWGEISYLEGLERSSNVAFANLVDKMGNDKWKNYMDAFGMGKSTDSGLANEAAGTIAYNYPLEKANTAFGQGLTVTDFQMLQAFSAVANNGKMVKPYFVEKKVDPNTGKETVTQPTVVGQPISEETAKKELEYLQEVVYSENGTGQIYQIPNYRIAAKTGTAEIVDPNTGLYATGDNNYVFSVAGMAPADDPELILYVTMKQPQVYDGTVTGGAMIAEVFNPVMERALQYQELGKEANADDTNQVVMPKVTGGTKESAVKTLEDNKLDVTIVGNGDTIVQQMPLPNETVLEGQRAMVLTNGAMTMPNMVGWSKNDVLKVSEMTGQKFKIEGDGFVTAQSLAENSNMEGAGEIVITLATPQ